MELEKRDLVKYVNSILTAHVVKTPPDHEAGLALLLRLRGETSFFINGSPPASDLRQKKKTKETDPSIVEDAVKYIIFLVDANQLFDTALGMYDFSLVIMIAQHAQKVSLILFLRYNGLSQFISIFASMGFVGDWGLECKRDQKYVTYILFIIS